MITLKSKIFQLLGLKFMIYSELDDTRFMQSIKVNNTARIGKEFQAEIPYLETDTQPSLPSHLFPKSNIGGKRRERDQDPPENRELKRTKEYE